MYQSSNGNTPYPQQPQTQVRFKDFNTFFYRHNFSLAWPVSLSKCLIAFSWLSIWTRVVLVSCQMVSGWAGHLAISVERNSIPPSVVCGDIAKSHLNMLTILIRHFHYRYLFVKNLDIFYKFYFFSNYENTFFSNLPVVRYVTIWHLHPVRLRVGSLKN